MITTKTIVIAILVIMVLGQILRMYRRAKMKKHFREMMQEINEILDKKIALQNAIEEELRKAPPVVAKKKYVKSGKYAKKGKKKLGRPFGWKKGIDFLKNEAPVAKGASNNNNGTTA